jgi:hypothetical protein
LRTGAHKYNQSYMRHRWTIGLLLLAVISLLADSPAPAKRFTVYSADKSVRVDSIPKDTFGSKGKTQVFDVTHRKKLLYQFDWYANGLRVERTPSGISLIRFGAWPWGQKASRDVPAFSFYLGEKLLKSYSTLDIAGDPDNVISSVSHHIYAHGERAIRYNAQQRRFELGIERIDGRFLTFDIETGEMLSNIDKYAGIRHSAWFRENLSWTRELPPREIPDPRGSGPSRLVYQRKIWAGTVQPCSATQTNWSIMLEAPVQMEPQRPSGLLLQVHCTNSVPCPVAGEFWAFSGTANGPILMMNAGNRFPEYERELDQP